VPKSTQELSLEKNAEKIERLHQERLRNFERGLRGLRSFDVDKIESDLDRDGWERKYKGSCYGDLAKIMADAEHARRAAGEHPNHPPERELAPGEAWGED
jgi:hypothetical protein